MSTYQFFIILHGLKDVLVWLVPLLITILCCATAIFIAFRWIHVHRSTAAGIAALAAKVDEIDQRLAVLEEQSGTSGEADIHGNEAEAE